MLSVRRTYAVRSVNPYEKIPGTSGPDVMSFYRGKYQHENIPHIYALAEDTCALPSALFVFCEC